MNEHESRSVVLIRSLEMNDPDGEIIPKAARLAASRQAQVEGARAETQIPSGKFEPIADESFILRRAQILRTLVEERFPIVAGVLGRMAWPPAFSMGIVIAAFLGGLLTNYVTAEKRVSILAFPLLGMITWNLVVYGLIVIQGLRSRIGVSESRFVSGPFIRGLSRAVVAMADSPAFLKRRSGHPEVLTQALGKFAMDWVVLSKPLQFARVRFALHLGAAMLALGAVCGMYIRGIALEYLAGWESTFLSAPTVHVVVSVVLGPASWMTGIPIPDEKAIMSLRWAPDVTGQNAAPWIHLYAATVGWLIVIPRCLLAGLEARRTSRLANPCPFIDFSHVYFRDLKRTSMAPAKYVRVAPYSMHLDSLAKEELQALCLELFGCNANVRFEEPVSYGLEDAAAVVAPKETVEPPVCMIPIFNMAATPEAESQGRFLENIKHFAEAPGSPNEVLVLVDESSFRQRFGGDSGLDYRIEERRRLWTRFIQGHGLGIACVHLTAGGLAAGVGQIRDAIWNSKERTSG